jgi:hypothetical protein
MLKSNLDIDLQHQGIGEDQNKESSFEVEQLKKIFQAASIFKSSDNIKALGICYNNIANIQYKNQQYL